MVEVETLSGVREIPAAEWNALVGDESPFLEWEWLASLEDAGCVGAKSGWTPRPLVVRDSGRLVAAVPLYVKTNSEGEFVFDWGWADAYERTGRRYYPKLVASVPFTPATGARLLVRPGADAALVHERLIHGALAAATELRVSSLHVLFPTETERERLGGAGFLSRKGCQFHWHNEGYADFDDFLGRFSSAKRKKAKRERRRVAEAEIEFEHLRGDQPTPAEWDAIFEFYSHTFERRGRAPYLNRAFFDEIARTMPENLLIILARYRAAPIACAICFRGGDTLYGRYWGSAADFHSLHFETCYYQGIDYCIREGLAKFEPGTQGEHKISRGFTPHATWSCHWIADSGFHDAVADFLARETQHVDAYMDELDEHVPYRDGASGSIPAQ